MNTPKIIFKSDIPEDALSSLANVFIEQIEKLLETEEGKAELEKLFRFACNEQKCTNFAENVNILYIMRKIKRDFDFYREYYSTCSFCINFCNSKGEHYYMNVFDEKATICFVGAFNMNYLKSTIPKDHYVCSFFDYNQLTDTLIFENDLTFVKSDKNGQILLYWSDTYYVITIQTGEGLEEKCAIAVLNFFDGYFSAVNTSSLLEVLQYSDKVFFYPSITVDEAKHHIAKAEALVEITGKIYISEYDFDLFEKLWGELTSASKYDIAGMFNFDIIPALSEYFCDIFLCPKTSAAFLKGPTVEMSDDILFDFN